MGTTTFSGPLKAGTIKDTTGTTVGTDVANVGYGVLAQSAVLDIAGATTTTTIGYNIKIFCDYGSRHWNGDIASEVGTSSSGAQLLLHPDEILDGGATVDDGNVTTTTLVATAHNAATMPLCSPQYAASRAYNLL
jgi:hypothetical protein